MSRESAESTCTAQLIDDERALSGWLARVSGQPRIALDAEGDGMFRYRARLCTVQLAVADEIAIVDTLAVSASAALGPLFGADGPEKIIHDASFDARMLQAYGAPLARVFDTAIAARFLGIAATGLSSLLAARFDIRLEKTHQQADWGKRPISEPMLRYLEEDVRHLELLYASLLEDVRAKDIEPEVREECAYVLSQALAGANSAGPSAPWMRIKGAGQLLPAQRALIRALAEERERIARLDDVPPGRLLSNDALLRLTLQSELNETLVRQALGSRASAHAECFIACLAQAAEVCDAPADEVQALCPTPPSLAQIETKKRRRKWLTEFRAREAASRGVDLQVVLPGHCLADIADLPALDREQLGQVSGFGACRLERYQTALATEFSARW